MVQEEQPAPLVEVVSKPVEPAPAVEAVTEPTLQLLLNISQCEKEVSREHFVHEMRMNV